MTKKGAGKGKDAVKPKDAKKIVEEQMFGMKNKNKSSKLKKLASTLEASYMRGRKEERKEEKPDVGVLQKVPVGIDPKTVFCINYKNGVCQKDSNECKFSHEPNAEKRIALLMQEGQRKKEQALEAAEKKRIEAERIEKEKKEKKEKSTTAAPERICKYYIDALKTGKHNPKWVCPIGSACQDKHSPPEGYSLKDAFEEDITIEEYIEVERAKLPEKQMPMTAELFERWKKEREQQKIRDEKEKEKIKEGNIRLGKILPSGKDLFVYKPDLFVDDEEAMECDYNAREEEEIGSDESIAQDLQSLKV